MFSINEKAWSDGFTDDFHQPFTHHLRTNTNSSQSTSKSWRRKNTSKWILQGQHYPGLQMGQRRNKKKGPIQCYSPASVHPWKAVGDALTNWIPVIQVGDLNWVLNSWTPGFINSGQSPVVERQLGSEPADWSTLSFSLTLPLK